MRFGRKKIFFLQYCIEILYIKLTVLNFFDFIDNFRNLHSKISSEKPYFLIFTGDFNTHSVQWWPNGDSNNEGTQLNILFSELGLTQLISEPTHFRTNCQPSCIDLIICDQPNIVCDSGVSSALDQTCKHQIPYCKLSIKSPRIPASKRLVWHYDKANSDLINRAIYDFQWDFHLNKLPNPNSQVKFLNKTILNIITNFVPSSTIMSNIREPKWVTRYIKNISRKQQKFYNKGGMFSGYQKIKNYLKSLGDKLFDNTTGPKTYWGIINSVLNSLF